jgi:hypothetical protein
MNVGETVGMIEAAGATFRLDGEKVRVRYCNEEQRKELTDKIAFLRDHRAEVAAFLKIRGTIPTMPPGVRLIHWCPKESPIAIESCAVVTDTARFVRTTLEQLRMALAQPKRWVGWSVPQLVDRLAQVGVLVAVDSKV